MYMGSDSECIGQLILRSFYSLVYLIKYIMIIFLMSYKTVTTIFIMEYTVVIAMHTHQPSFC